MNASVGISGQCLTCGKRFVPRTRNHFHCKAECRIGSGYSLAVSYADETLVGLDDFTFGGIPELECPTCRGGFVPKRQGHVYCSTKCRKYASNRARKPIPRLYRESQERYREHNVSTSVTLDRDTHAELKAYASKQEKTFSAAVRELLEWAIEDHVECRN